MPDPVSFVVAALVKGMVSGFAQRATADGYDALKNYLFARYGRAVKASVTQLETRPDSVHYQNEVGERLREAGAGHDDELIRLADELVDVVENPERHLRPGPPGPGSVAPDPVADLRRATGLSSIGKLLDEHVSKVFAIRSEYQVDDRDLLSGNARNSKDAPRQIRDNAAALHDRMRTIIQQIAATIEGARYREVEAAIQELPAGLAERERASRLIRADKQMHISYEALRVTVEFFSELNRGVLARIEAEQSRTRQANIMFGNAVMIYELTDFVIGYIETFTLGSDLDALRADAKRRVNTAREAEKEFADRIRARNVEQGVLDQTLQDIKDREEALDFLDREWDRYLGEMGDMRQRVDEVRRSIPTLETIRENAERQITALQLVAMLSFLRQSTDSLRPTMETLKGFQLAPLNESRVRRLLGM